MPTSTRLAKAKSFSAKTGKLSRVQQLKWFGKELGIGEPQLLRLVGYAPALIERKRVEGEPFEVLAEANPEGTVWVSELLRELASRSGYDLGRLKTALRPPAPAKHKPLTVSPPAGLAPKSPTRRRSEVALLRSIQAGGPAVYDDLIRYLQMSARPQTSGRPQRSAKD